MSASLSSLVLVNAKRLAVCDGHVERNTDEVSVIATTLCPTHDLP